MTLSRPMVEGLAEPGAGGFTHWQHEYERWERRRGFTRQTIRQRRTILGSFARWLAPFDVLDATSDDVEAWLDHRPLENHTRYSYISTLSCFFTFVCTAGGLDGNPCVAVIRPKRRRLVPRPVPRADLFDALARADARLYAMICLAAFSGLRVREIAGLHVEDVRVDEGLLIVRDGKGGKERVVPLAARTEAAMRRYGPPKSGPMFVNLETGEQLTPSGVSRLIAEHFRACGVDATGHQCRHLFATSVYRKSLDLRMTQELMGHADPATTAIYAAFADERAASIVRDL